MGGEGEEICLFYVIATRCVDRSILTIDWLIAVTTSRARNKFAPPPHP